MSRKNPVLDGPCCRLELCCDPPRAAEALAAYLSIPKEAAAAVLAEHYLVPRTLEPGPEPTSSEHLASARKRLEGLHRRLAAELKSILLGMGYASPKGTG